MSQTVAPPIPSLVPETAPFSPEQRAWLNGFFAGLVSLDGAGVTALSPEQSAALMPGAGERIRRRRTSGDAPWHDQTLASAGPHEARRRPPAPPQDDGRDGATGLRPVRLQLRGLFEPHRREERRAAEPLRAGRQGNRPHAQVAVRRARQGAGACHLRRSSPSLRRRAERRRHLARQSGDGDIPLAHAAQPPGSEKETWHIEVDLADHAASTTWSAIPSASFRPTIRRWSTPSSRRSTRRPTFRSAAARCARC